MLPAIVHWSLCVRTSFCTHQGIKCILTTTKYAHTQGKNSKQAYTHRDQHILVTSRYAHTQGSANSNNKQVRTHLGISVLYNKQVRKHSSNDKRVSTHRDQCTLVGSIYRDAYALELDNRARIRRGTNLLYAHRDLITSKLHTLRDQCILFNAKQVHTQLGIRLF